MNARNNLNGFGDVPRNEVFTLRHADLTAVQEAVVRKLVTELNAFDNPLATGGLFGHLDYSFTPSHRTGRSSTARPRGEGTPASGSRCGSSRTPSTPSAERRPARSTAAARRR
jgi:hypothetical protein